MAQGAVAPRELGHQSNRTGTRSRQSSARRGQSKRASGSQEQQGVPVAHFPGACPGQQDALDPPACPKAKVQCTLALGQAGGSGASCCPGRAPGKWVRGTPCRSCIPPA
eukprot:7194024-Lingulodinium_polyedra.AAC.1